MEITDWRPTREQGIHLRDFSRNGEHYINNLSRIREEYAGKFVAVHDEEVILSKSNAKDLLSELRSMFSEPKLSEVYVAYVPTEQEVRIA